MIGWIETEWAPPCSEMTGISHLHTSNVSLPWEGSVSHKLQWKVMTSYSANKTRSPDINTKSPTEKEMCPWHLEAKKPSLVAIYIYILFFFFLAPPLHVAQQMSLFALEVKSVSITDWSMFIHCPWRFDTQLCSLCSSPENTEQECNPH